jgi:predicted nucleic acid-binding protein
MRARHRPKEPAFGRPAEQVALIHLDTSVLIDALTGPRRSSRSLRQAIEAGERIELSTLVLYEWIRGPRRSEELLAQEALFPAERAVPFGSREAALAASWYGRLKKPRGREIDLAIAACALAREALLWTLNVKDFADIPDLSIYEPEVDR